MIIKEPDYQTAIDATNKLLDSGRVTGELEEQLKREVAGIVAEQQVAYRLKANLQSDDELYVFNNLAVQYGAVQTQIDHLIFSARTFYIIESKSIHGTIKVNEHGEFFRQYGRKIIPMNSPIEQVMQQQKIFIQLLDINKSSILGKILTRQKGLWAWTPKYFIAISEKGIIAGTGRDQFKELRKFDQIVPEIIKHHKETRPKIFSLGGKKGEEINLFNKKEIQKLIDFLKASDISKEPIEKIKEILKKPQYQSCILPQTNKPHAPVAAPSQPQTTSFACSKCGSKNLQIAYGNSYYFKCKDCQANTPIRLTCEKCGSPMRTRKQKNEFFKTCGNCNIDTLYFVND